MKLTDVFSPRHILTAFSSDDKKTVISELTGLLVVNNRIENQEAVRDALMQREELMTTGVGNGVAIPHCKTPYAETFSVALGIHKEGVDFKSLDNLPTKIIFLLTGPENQPGGHIRLLSRISRLISDEKLREYLLTIPPSKDIFEVLLEKESNFLEARSIS